MKINFLKYYKVFFTVSLVIIAITLVLTSTKGLNLGTDFKGGLEAEISFPNSATTKEIIEEKLKNSSGISLEVEEILSKENTYIIRLPLIDNDALKTEAYLNEQLENNTPDASVEQVRIIGGVLSSQNQSNAFWISLVVILLITLYLTMRFKLSFGVAAMSAVIHDIFIIFFFISLYGLEVNTLVIVAVLTIFGYSVNDTIVLFVRIREVISRAKEDKIDLKATLNSSINQIISRTLITSLTTLFVVSSLFVATEGVYREFALLLMIGIASGTYSSIYVACPTLLIWDKRVKPITITKKS